MRNIDIKPLVEEMKASITIEECIRRYTDEVPRMGRIRCPIHNGNDRNFSFREKYYHCFVCNAHGDCISLVMALFGCSFMSALQKLDFDFGLNLGIGSSLSPRKQEENAERLQERAKQSADEKRKKEQKAERYNEALDKVIQNDLALRNLPDSFDSMTDEFVTALIQKDYSEYILSGAEVEHG